jgi:hypothetical protein
MNYPGYHEQKKIMFINNLSWRGREMEFYKGETK